MIENPVLDPDPYSPKRLNALHLRRVERVRQQLAEAEASLLAKPDREAYRLVSHLRRCCAHDAAVPLIPEGGY